MTKMRAVAAGAVALVASVVPLQAASAITDPYPMPPPDQVAGEEVTRTVREPQERVLAAQVTRGQELPVTGGDLLGLTALGLGAVGTGFVLVRRGRRAD